MARHQGLDVVPAPAFQAQLPPAIIILRLTAHVDHGVDGGGAPDDLAAWIIQHPPVEPGNSLGPEHPVGARIADGEEIADGDMKPNPVILAARLQYGDAIVRISREPVGENAAGGARTDDDIVELRLFWLAHAGRFPPRVDCSRQDTSAG